jgi:hypothetical protein
MPGSVEHYIELVKYASKKRKSVLLPVMNGRWGSLPEVWYQAPKVFIRQRLFKTKRKVCMKIYVKIMNSRLKTMAENTLSVKQWNSEWDSDVK